MWCRYPTDVGCLYVADFMLDQEGGSFSLLNWISRVWYFSMYVGWQMQGTRVLLCLCWLSCWLAVGVRILGDLLGGRVKLPCGYLAVVPNLPLLLISDSRPVGYPLFLRKPVFEQGELHEVIPI